MAKRFRSDTQIWLFGKCPPVVNEEKQIKFTGARSPTVADVFLNYCGQHQYFQTETKRQSSRRDAAKRTASELLLW